MKLVSVPPLIMLYIMRLCSLFLYTGLCYQAIKIIPFKKWLFAALALLPTAVYQGAMVNTDGLTTGLGFLFIALTFYYAYGINTKIIGKKQLFMYLGCGLWFLVCKFAYAPVLLIYFLIPKERFESQKLRYKAFAWAAILLFLFVIILFRINNSTTSYTDYVYMRQTAFAFLIEKPIIFIKAAFYTLLVKGNDCLTGVIGSFGWGEVKIPPHIAGLYYLSLLLFSVFNFKEEQTQKTPETVHKLLFAGIFILYSILLFVILYLNFQISKDGIIDGFWGRYFIPVLPFIFLCFQNKKFFVKTNALIFVNLVLINFVLFVSLIRILYRFYV